MDKEVKNFVFVGTIREDGFVEKEPYGQSEDGIYKNENEFKPGGGICYIPELTGTFIKGYPIPEGFIENESSTGIVNKTTDEYIEYAAAYTYDNILEMTGGNKEIAKSVFDTLDWQHPSSYIDSDLGAIGIIPCDNCKYLVDIEYTNTCPKCGSHVE